MKLKPVRTLSPVMLKGRVPGDLYEALVAYAAYYRGVHGEAIELWALLLQILSTFLDADREFHTWRGRPGEAMGRGWSRGMGSRATAGLRSLDSKIKGEGRMAPKCARLLGSGRPSASEEAIQPSRREGRLRAVVRA